MNVLSRKERLKEQAVKSIEQDRGWTKVFRRVLFTPEGLMVLTWILNECFYYADEIKGEEQVVLNNFARRLLKRLGVHKSHNLYRLAQFYGKLPPYSVDENTSYEEMKK